MEVSRKYCFTSQLDKDIRNLFSLKTFYLQMIFFHFGQAEVESA